MEQPWHGPKGGNVIYLAGRPDLEPFESRETHGRVEGGVDGVRKERGKLSVHHPRFARRARRRQGRGGVGNYDGARHGRNGRGGPTRRC